VSRILLDTSAYSAFLSGHAAVVESVRQADEIYLNPIILGEMLAGFRKGTHRSRNEEELSRFLGSPRVAILDLDEESSERYATILDYLRKKGTPIATHDLWIAATAMQYGLRVVTLDSDFEKVPQILVERHAR
jgi:tRNA(fMet)-specific endonuclease VapC